MRRLLLAVAFLCAVCIPSDAGMNPYVAGSVSVAAAPDYSDILFHEGFEHATNAAKPSALARSLTGGGALDTDGTPVPPAGSNTLNCPDDYARSRYTVTSDDIIVGDHGRVGFYAYFDTFAQWAILFDYTVDANNRIYISQYSSSHLYFYYKAGGTSTAITGSTTVTTEGWHWIEAKWDNTGNSYQLWLDGASQGTSTDNLSDWAGTGGSNALQFGDAAGVVSNFHMDQCIISNDPARDLDAVKTVTDFN